MYMYCKVPLKRPHTLYMCNFDAHMCILVSPEETHHTVRRSACFHLVSLHAYVQSNGAHFAQRVHNCVRTRDYCIVHIGHHSSFSGALIPVVPETACAHLMDNTHVNVDWKRSTHIRVHCAGISNPCENCGIM